MKTKTFNIALPAALIKKIDETAEKEYRNRSELIREAVRIYLQDKEEWAEIFEYGKSLAKKKGIKSEREINEIVARFRHQK